MDAPATSRRCRGLFKLLRSHRDIGSDLHRFVLLDHDRLVKYTCRSDTGSFVESEQGSTAVRHARVNVAFHRVFVDLVYLGNATHVNSFISGIVAMSHQLVSVLEFGMGNKHVSAYLIRVTIQIVILDSQYRVRSSKSFLRPDRSGVLQELDSLLRLFSAVLCIHYNLVSFNGNYDVVRQLKGFQDFLIGFVNLLELFPCHTTFLLHEFYSFQDILLNLEVRDLVLKVGRLHRLDREVI